MTFAKSISWLATASLCLGLASNAVAETRYTVLDLGAVNASALNDLGQVAGTIYNDDSSVQAFYTGANGIGLTLLTTPTGGNSWAHGINNSGQVVGDYSNGSGSTGYVTGAGAQGITSVDYPSVNSTSLIGINDSGQTVGWVADEPTQAIVSGPNGTGWHTVDLPSSMLTSQGRTINASGQVLVMASDMSSEIATTTFVTGPNGQGARQVGSIGDILLGTNLNNHGDVVGLAHTETGDFGFFADANDGTVTYLGTLGENFSLALALNDQGTIVGFSSTSPGFGFSAFIVEGKGQDMVALDSLAIDFDGHFSEAVAVNNAGQILARNGQRSYLLTPAIPEAQTSAMLMLGFLGVAWATGRRAKTAPTPQA